MNNYWFASTSISFPMWNVLGANRSQLLPKILPADRSGRTNSMDDNGHRLQAPKRISPFTTHRAPSLAPIIY